MGNITLINYEFIPLINLSLFIQITEQKEDMRVWCCDDDPEIKGLSEGIKKRKLGEFLSIKCSPGWGYGDEKRRMLGINDDSIVIFYVWVKEVDPYLNHDPKCCTIL